MTNHPHSDPDVVARYVAGTLPDSERRDFELHLLDCASCQRDVREGVAIRGALRNDPEAARAPRPFRVARSRWIGIAGMAAAAAIVVVAVRPRAPDLASLPSAPRIASVDVRGGDTRMLRTDSAVAAYAAGDYQRARPLLQAVLDSAFDPALAFYAGHAALADGDARGAVRLLAQLLADTASARRATPFRGDAAYVLAKAWLRLREPDSALAALQASSTPAARALADSIRVAYGR